MQEGRPSRTAEYIAFYRALESARPAARRLFEDRLAASLLPPSLRRAVRLSRLPLIGAAVGWYSDRRAPGARTSGVARTRWIDDALCSALQDGARQVVILGAGFDCRAHRLACLGSAAVFEVDHPATLAVKLERLHGAGDIDRERVRRVAIDFSRRDLGEALREAGFDPTIRSVLVWEGVTNYLTVEAVNAVLGFCARCAPGSRLIFTYVHRGALESSPAFPDAPALLRRVARLGEPWTFGLDPAELPGYLRARGLRLERDEGARAYRLRYFGPAARGMKGYDFYHAAVAVVPAVPAAGGGNA